MWIEESLCDARVGGNGY